uniref:Tegument protein UL26 n=1 Tax=Mastomys natalensis cytomegalovirus 1 TaxID=2973541 RepID=A0A9Y1IKN6_9BETA|nr:tegument protein UL26 [Mastomys natalensis cytomegalovirus 1]WEG68891.1 tegument protein UL26 [Mastomys natalensis cytomegalovirus 1]WEG71119.1 tegument protein UL26 [Mastomys natalensis cytomegalovirus 1]
MEYEFECAAGTPATYDHDSPYSASGSDICELMFASSVGPHALESCVNRLRGVEVALMYPKGLVFYVGGEDDTILTPRDMQYWKMHPLMLGEVHVIGSIGYKRTLAWDRRVLGVNAVGQVYAYEMYETTFIMKAATTVTELLTQGVCRKYVNLQRNLIDGIKPAVVEMCRDSELHLPRLPSGCKQWLPVEVGGVRCARVPCEKIRSAAKLRLEDIPDCGCVVPHPEQRS